MTIQAILARRDGITHSATADETVGAVVKRLNELRIGAVPIMDGGSVVGIFSERDLLRAVAESGPDVLNLSIASVMTSPAVGIEPEASVLSGLSLMTRRRFRHLPVIKDGAMVGFVSIGDLVKHRIEAIEAEAAAMREYIAGN